MIDGRHELVKLAALIDWEVFEREWAGFFPSGTGRPAAEPRLLAGLLYLQHAYQLSDEAVVARWVENQYDQHFTGEVFIQHRLPIDPSSLTRWRGRIGEEGVEWLLTLTIRDGQESGVIDADSAERVAVDTTVMETNIAFTTEARLYERARDQLAALAQEAGVDLRQSYARLSSRLALQVGRYAHAKQFNCTRKALKRGLRGLHSAIRFVTLNARHGGQDHATLASRAILFTNSRAQNLHRLSGKSRNWQPAVPVWLNTENEIGVPEIRDAA